MVLSGVAVAVVNSPDPSWAAIVAAGVSSATALGGLILAVAVLLPNLRVARETHALVNQKYTDAVNYQNALIRELITHGIAVPVDQSHPDGGPGPLPVAAGRGRGGAAGLPGAGEYPAVDGDALDGGAGGLAAGVQDDGHDTPGGDHAKLGHVPADVNLDRSAYPLGGPLLRPPAAPAELGKPLVLVVDGPHEPARPSGVRVDLAGGVVGAEDVDPLPGEVGDVGGGGVLQPGRYPVAGPLVCAVEQGAGAVVEQL
jgi:hypothetical protein